MYLCEQKSINKVLRIHGGLHNCVTYRLPVLPFTLHECKQYMRAKKIQVSHYDLLEYYMVFGRAPFFCSLLTLEECGFIRKIPTYGLKNQAMFPDRQQHITKPIQGIASFE